MPERVGAVEDWWYFGSDHGQHIAFYTIPALEVIAKHFGLYLATDGVGNHLLSSKPVSSRVLRFFASGANSAKGHKEGPAPPDGQIIAAYGRLQGRVGLQAVGAPPCVYIGLRAIRNR